MVCVHKLRTLIPYEHDRLTRSGIPVSGEFKVFVATGSQCDVIGPRVLNDAHLTVGLDRQSPGSMSELPQSVAGNGDSRRIAKDR